MTTKTIKTILFASLIAAMILPFSGMMMAEAAPNENANDKAKEIAEQKILKDKKFDEIGESILKLQVKNQALENVSKNDKVRNENARDIELLFAEMDKIDPPTPTKEISPGLEKKMNAAIMKLVESDFPLYAMGISSETGLLDVKVDSSKATNIDDKIQTFVGEEIPLNIEYGINKNKLQAGSCDQTTGLCAPLIGGSDGRDKY